MIGLSASDWLNRSTVWPPFVARSAIAVPILPVPTMLTCVIDASMCR